MFKRIVIPLDGSDLAERALVVGSDLALRLSASIVLVQVIEVVPFQTESPFNIHSYTEAGALIKDHTQTYLTSIAEQFAIDGITCETHVLKGMADKQITRFAEPDDLIVLTSHGRTGLNRWLLGSVAEAVVRHARGSVLVHRVSTGLVSTSSSSESSRIAVETTTIPVVFDEGGTTH